jgi:hypothetical protein
MKKALAILSVALIVISSCKKSVISTPVAQVSIVEKWNIVTDSVFSQYFLSTQPTISVYVGVPTDYYDFRKNDSIYIKEGNLLDTFSYWISSDSLHGSFNGDGFIVNFSNLTDSSLVLQTYGAPTPEFSSYSIIHLKRR